MIKHVVILYCSTYVTWNDGANKFVLLVVHTHNNDDDNDEQVFYDDDEDDEGENNKDETITHRMLCTISCNISSTNNSFIRMVLVE